MRWEQIKFGLYLIVIGLIKKVVFADTIAQYVNPLFEKGLEMSAVEAWWAAYLFGFQIYFDFSAYSDMALGLGWMLGIELVVNFRTPYVSANPKEFWSRWHISLSRWIRDYIYIPLGGNRRGRLRTQFNLLAAMMLSGLWHGAMWTFVVWGAVHGVLQIIHRWSLELNRFGVIERVRRSLPYRIIAVFIFYHIITWTWVFFRAQSMTLAWDMTVKMWTVSWPELFTSTPMFAIAALYLLHLLELGLRGREETVSRVWHAVPFPLRSACYFAIVLLLFYFLKGKLMNSFTSSSSTSGSGLQQRSRVLRDGKRRRLFDLGLAGLVAFVIAAEVLFFRNVMFYGLSPGFIGQLGELEATFAHHGGERVRVAIFGDSQSMDALLPEHLAAESDYDGWGNFQFQLERRLGIRHGANVAQIQEPVARSGKSDHRRQ